MEEITARLGDVHKRIDDLRGEMSQHFGNLNKRLDDFRGEVNNRFGEVNNHFTDLHQRFTTPNHQPFSSRNLVAYWTIET